MWKPTNQPQTPGRPAEPEQRPIVHTPSAPAMMANEPAAAPRPATPTTTTTADQATIGKSLVIKREVTGSESLYIDSRVEGSISLSGNRVTVRRSDASLTGDVIAARISIEDGAYFKGGIDIRKGGQPTQAGQQKPNGKDESVTASEPAAVGARA